MHLIYTTFPSLEEARRIINLLLEKRLIACANLFPSMESHYIWEEKRYTETEVAAFLKTTQEKYVFLEKLFLEVHPYEVPCFIVLSPEHVNAAFEKAMGKAQCNVTPQ